MYPKLYNNGGDLQAILDNIVKESATISRAVNAGFTFSFEAYEKELKSEYFDPDNSLVVDSQTFDIKYIEQTHELAVLYAIECEHVNYRMEDGSENLYASYAFTGTPTQILTNILAGTEFTTGTIDFTDVMTVSVNEEITRKALIYQLANLLGGEIEYTDMGFTINILDTIGQDNGFEVRLGKNLKGITKTIDSRGGLKTYYEVDLLELKNSNEYQEKQLQDLEVIGIGDTIRIVDEVIGLDVQNRIVSIEYNPIFAKNTTLEISNEIELITDTINQISTDAVIKDKVYNNASISTEYGFRSELSDKTARASFGGGELAMEVGDGLGNYTKAVYFDSVAGKYKIVGDLDATGIITGGDIIGGTITGALFQTAATGRHIEMSSTNKEYINFIDSGDNVYASIAGNFKGVSSDALTLLANDKMSLSVDAGKSYISMRDTFDPRLILEDSVEGVAILTEELTLDNPFGGADPIVYGVWDYSPEVNFRNGIKFADTITGSIEATIAQDASDNLDLVNSYGDISLEAIFDDVLIAGSSGQAEFGSTGARLYHSFVEKLRTGSSISNLYGIWYYKDSSSDEEIATKGYISDNEYSKLFKGAGVTTAYFQAFTDRAEIVVNGTPHTIVTY